MSTPALLALDPDSRVVVLGAPGFVQVHRVNGWPLWNTLYSADAVGDCGEPLCAVPADDFHGDADLDGWMDCCPELAYTSDDCDGPDQDHHDGHTPDPMPSPEGEPCGYELRHLEAVRRRWPEAVHLFTGRGSWRKWTIVWPGTVRTTINLAKRQTSVDQGGISFSSAAPASWSGRDGPAAMVRDLDRALFEHRVPWLLWVPPSVDPWRTWDGETRYNETWRGDVDHIVYTDHGGGVVGCSAWLSLWGRSVGAFPTEKDCDAPRCALSGPIYTPCTYADCDLELGGGCVLRGPPA